MKSFSNNEQESVSIDVSALATSAKQDTQTTELQAIKTAVEIIDNAVSGNEMQVDIVSSALPTGAATEATLGSIKTAVELLDNAIAGSEMQVDVVSSALPTGAATEATLGSIKTAVELLDNAISGNELQVDVLTSALPTGAATDAKLDSIIAKMPLSFSKSGTISAVNSNVFTGVPTANSTVAFDTAITGATSLSIHLDGTFSANLYAQVSIDGVQWFHLSARYSAAYVNSESGSSPGVVVTSAWMSSGDQALYRFDVAGFNYARVTCTSYSSGSVTVNMSAIAAPMNNLRKYQYVNLTTLGESHSDVQLGNGTSTGALRVAVASDNTIIPAYLGVSSASTNASTRVNSTAAEASKVLKASAGRLYSLTVTTSKTSDQYFQIFNSTTVPADTTAPIYVVKLPADSTINLDFGSLGGIYFATGISVSNSTTMATKTIGSSDCFISAEIA